MTHAELQALVDRNDLTGRDVFAFGHSRATVEIARALAAQGVPLSGFLDNSSVKQGQYVEDVPVLAPDAVLTIEPERAVVLIASRFAAQMRAQLDGIGYQGQVIELGSASSGFSITESEFEAQAERVRRGAAILTDLRGQAPNAHLIICPYDALGDVYWAMAYLPAYLAAYDIPHSAVAVTGHACHDVATLFGITPLSTLDQEDMDELVQAAVALRATGTASGGVLIAHHDRPYTNTNIRLLSRALLPFTEQYPRAVYGLAMSVPQVPNSHDRFGAADRVPTGRSVILAPYAKSVVGPPAGYWEDLATEHAAQGLVVFTNVVGEQAPIAGTHELRVPIRQMINAVEHAGTFIGLRSGLCDVLATARARKIVVFPDAYYSSTPHKVADFFALPGFEQAVVPV